MKSFFTICFLIILCQCSSLPTVEFCVTFNGVKYCAGYEPATENFFVTANDVTIKGNLKDLNTLKELKEKVPEVYKEFRTTMKEKFNKEIEE